MCVTASSKDTRSTFPLKHMLVRLFFTALIYNAFYRGGNKGDMERTQLITSSPTEAWAGNFGPFF